MQYGILMTLPVSIVDDPIWKSGTDSTIKEGDGQHCRMMYCLIRPAVSQLFLPLFQQSEHLTDFIQRSIHCKNFFLTDGDNYTHH